MIYDATESRSAFLTGKALMLAVAIDQSLPREERESSDTFDRLEMLRTQFHVTALAEFAHSVKRATGLVVDLYEDVWPNELKAHRQNFAAALAERMTLAA